MHIHELCVTTVSIDRTMGEVNFTGEEFLSALFADSPKCQEQCSEGDMAAYPWNTSGHWGAAVLRQIRRKILGTILQASGPFS